MFMLGRLVHNLKGSVMEEVLDEIMRKVGVIKDLELDEVVTKQDHDKDGLMNQMDEFVES